MPVNTPHPDLVLRDDEIKRNRDAVEGERAIKEEGNLYLPVPPGMEDGGSANVLEHKGRTSPGKYQFYKRLAEFPEELGESLAGFQGIIHSKPPTIKLPARMEYLLGCATTDELTLEQLWILMTNEIMVGGRVALLCDVVDDEIRFAPYSMENVRNWKLSSRRDGANPDWVVLREMVRLRSADDEFVTTSAKRYLELRKLPLDKAKTSENPLGIVYHRQIWQHEVGKDLEVLDPMRPISFQGQFFPEIPIIVINAGDIGYDYGPMPLSPLVKIALSLYRRSADYNRALYVKTDPQPVLFGVNEEDTPDKIGGLEIWAFTNPAGSATYLDIDGDGIPHQRTSIQDDWDRFKLQSAKMLEASDTPSESGEAVRRKQAAKQVTMKGMVTVAGFGLTMALKKIASYFGEGLAEDVLFEPDLDFAEPKITAEEAAKWQEGKNSGLRMSAFSIHELMRRGGATELSFEEENAMIEQEPETLPQTEPLPDGEPRNVPEEEQP